MSCSLALLISHQHLPTLPQLLLLLLSLASSPPAPLASAIDCPYSPLALSAAGGDPVSGPHNNQSAVGSNVRLAVVLLPVPEQQNCNIVYAGGGGI